MEIGDKLFKPTDATDEVAQEQFAKMYEEVARECNINHDRTIEDKGEYYEIVKVENEITATDYDIALENHLKQEREDRGYTTREPSDYYGSSVERWASDAIDWIAHRDQVMLFGLDIQNKYKNGEEIMSLEEFKEALPKITWSFK